MCLFTDILSGGSGTSPEHNHQRLPWLLPSVSESISKYSPSSIIWCNHCTQNTKWLPAVILEKKVMKSFSFFSFSYIKILNKKPTAQLYLRSSWYLQSHNPSCVYKQFNCCIARETTHFTYSFLIPWRNLWNTKCTWRYVLFRNRQLVANNTMLRNIENS